MNHIADELRMHHCVAQTGTQRHAHDHLQETVTSVGRFSMVEWGYEDKQRHTNKSCGCLIMWRRTLGTCVSFHTHPPVWG